MDKAPKQSRKPTPGKAGARRTSRGFQEAQALFGAAETGLYALFVAYEFRCAFTGADLNPEIKADPLSALLRLNGASNRAGDVIPASLDAMHAFEVGHLALGPKYEFIVALDRIRPEFLQTLAPVGRLRIPDSPRFRPRQKLLAAHLRAMIEDALP